MKISLLALVSCVLVLNSSKAQDALTKNFWDADAIVWGDGRPYEKPVKKEGPYPQGFKADFVFEIPKAGWYEVVFPQTIGDVRHNLLVDGKFVWRNRITSTLKASPQDVKAGNVWLTAGPHTLQVERVGLMGFPIKLIGGVSLRPADGRLEAAITANKTRVDIVRAGEKLEIEASGGGSEKAATYELLRWDLKNLSASPVVVGEIAFAASPAPEIKKVEVACPEEGAFLLGARVKGGAELLASEFPIGEYGVVDVRHVEPASGKLEVLHEIDCVAQTDLGKAISPENFREVNGPTHVVKTDLGSYRESHDCTAPGAEPMLSPDDPHSFSGFSYTLDLPEVQVPYLIDVEFPDNDRRSVTIIQNWIDEKTGGFAKGVRYSGKSYETGGMQPLSNKMQHHRVIVWAASKKMILGILSQQTGHRAAVAKITVSRFVDGKVPAEKESTVGGRAFTYWYEEAGNWEHLVNVGAQYPSGLVHNMIGLDRWARLCRYFGLNGISACGVGYQQAFWRNTTLPGFGVMSYDQCRLAALICEKYGMTFTPEVYPTQWYMNLVGLPEKVANPEDIRAVSCHGAVRGPGSAPTDLNALHPAVQQMWLDGIGELSDKLRDCPSFKGVTVRADAWGFRGDFNLPGLNWGYGDWTIREFEKDTGLKVPGKDGDPQRFIQRFEFLTSKENRDKWLSWRSRRIFDYHKKLRDRIRGDREDLYFGLAGDFRCDICYQIPDTLAERALDCGVDLERLHGEEGMAFIPYARYGRRNIGLKAQQDYDDFLDPQNVEAGMGVMRGFSAYMVYNELAQSWPAEKFGIAVPPRQAPYYCSAAVAAGRNSLEKFAVVLASQDSALLRDGGNTDICGDPALWNPWFAEYRALPALPFERLESARDPVAVWRREVAGVKGFEPGLYFYAVNREQYPVHIDIALEGSAEVTALGNGKPMLTPDGKLALDLQPYELRAFRAKPGARIVEATTIMPPERVESAKSQLAFGQDIQDMLNGDVWRDSISKDDRRAYQRQLDNAWKAYQKDRLWRVRTALSMGPSLKVYDGLARVPHSQFITAFPGLLKERPNEGHWVPRQPMLDSKELAALEPSKENVILKPSTDINPNWGGSEVLMAKDGVLELDLEVPANGSYLLKVGHVAKDTGVTTVTLNGKSLSPPIITEQASAPETFAFPPISLSPGKARLTMKREGEFGIYGLQLLPRLKAMPSSEWSTVGPFKAFWGLPGSGGIDDPAMLAKGLETPFIPENAVDLKGAYDDGRGQKVSWQQKKDSSIGDLNDAVVAMPTRTGSTQYDVNYAVCYIISDQDRLAQLDLAVDWWGLAWLNGERLRTNITEKLQKKCGGADFTSWYPYTTTLPLRKGVNTLLVKQHGGSLGAGFSAYISDIDGIVCQATPPPK